MIRIQTLLQKLLVIFAFLFVSFSLLIPMIVSISIGDLPYLHEWSFATRVLSLTLIWLSLIVFYLFLAKLEQKESVLKVLNYKTKNWIGAAIGLILFIYGSAGDIGNSLGLMVVKLPNENYSETVTVMQINIHGSKHKVLDVTLKSKIDDEIYHLTLSKRIMDYPLLKIGDSFILEAQKNWFGIYVNRLVK